MLAGVVAVTARRLVLVVLVIGMANLAANLARRKVRGVNIAIGGIGDERRDQRVEIAGRNVLRGRPNHASARDRSGYGSAARRTKLSSRRTVVEVGAEEHHDASRHMPLTEVNVRLRDRRT